MKKLTAEQIEMNWQTLIDLIEKYISEDRKENLLKFYEDFKERMMFAPASGKGAYHNAMPGGYVLATTSVAITSLSALLIILAVIPQNTWSSTDEKFEYKGEVLSASNTDVEIIRKTIAEGLDWKTSQFLQRE